MKNRDILNKVSTIAVVISIGALVSLSGVFSNTFANNCGYGYGYGSCKTGGTPEDDVFNLEDDSRVLVGTAGDGNIEGGTGGGDVEEDTEGGIGGGDVGDGNTEGGIGGGDVEEDAEVSAKLRSGIKELLDIDDNEFNDLLDLAKEVRKDPSKKPGLVYLVKHYLERKKLRESEAKSENNENASDNNEKNYPTELHKTGAGF